MKTFRTVGSGSTQTLEKIENNKIPIYETKAAAEADIANLTDGQIIATKDEGNENAKPVDVVENGNMHAVTSNAVYDYTYSKYDTTAGFQRSFVKVGNVGTYTKIYNLPASSGAITDDLSSTFSLILGVIASPNSYGGRYPKWYWLNNNNANLEVNYSTDYDSLLVVQITGVLKENYTDPF